MHILYNVGIYLMEYACCLACLWSTKIRTLVRGQRQTFEKIANFDKQDKVIWFHCSSLGEFEQARNLIEVLKQTRPEYKILVSFFSPSGYEIQKNYKKADCVVYLPFDTPRNARKFIACVHPALIFFVKYEFWYNYIIESRDIPLFQVSLILRDGHYLCKSFSGWFVKQLRSFDKFFVQDEKTKDILEKLGYKNSVICGDTRFDRVLQIASQSKELPIIEEFCEGEKKVFVAGSSWEPDEKIIRDALADRDELKLIIAPHLIGRDHIQNLKKMFPGTILYSEAAGKSLKEKKVLIIDCIGILSKIYAWADIAYIGGGFGVGIHNILEAAVYYKPLIFGPNNKKFNEARDLICKGAAKEITNSEELAIHVDKLLKEKNFFENVCNESGDYVKNNSGATKKIMEEIEKYL